MEVSHFSTARAAALSFLVLMLAASAGCVSASTTGVMGTPSGTISRAAGEATTTAAQAASGAPSRHVCAPPYLIGVATAATIFCADPGSLVSSRVIRIVDGDTLHVDLGGRDETVRLYGINAAERGQPCSIEATERLRALAGSTVLLRSDARDRDRYGRLLRYVYSPTGLSIDAELVDEGLAKAWRQDGDLRLPIIELEGMAATAHRGCIGG